MRYNKNEFSEEIIFDRDTSQPKDKLKFRRRLRRPEEQKPPNKSSELKFSLFDNGKNNLNENEDNSNNKENGGKKDENTTKLSNGKNDGKDSDLNNNNNNKETQNAFIQVNFLDEIIENERKKILLKYKEKENEMKLQINDLINNMRISQIDSNKEILELKTKINEKKEEIIDLKNLNSNLKKQVENLTDKISNLNNQILDLKRKNRIYMINSKKENINDENENKNENDNDNDSKNRPLFDFYSKNIGNKNDLSNHNTRYNPNDSFKEKNKINDELERIKEYKKKDPTRVKLNRSSIDIKNKNRINNIVLQMNETNKDFINGKNVKDKYKSNPNLSIDYLSKRISNNKRRETLQKMQKDYSLKIYNNIFDELNNDFEKRANSARIINLKKHTFEANKTSVNKIFNDTERKALSTLFDSQEEFINFNKKINVLENHNDTLVRKLLLQNKILTKENENKKEEVNILLEKLKVCESKLRTANHNLNYEKYILNKTKKSFYGTKTSFGGGKK